MLTDLLIGGLLLASSPAQAADVGVQPAPASLRSDARPGTPPCVELSRASGRSALLEAHAAYAGLAPFSLARTPSPATPNAPAVVSSAPACKA